METRFAVEEDAVEWWLWPAEACRAASGEGPATAQATAEACARIVDALQRLTAQVVDKRGHIWQVEAPEWRFDAARACVHGRMVYGDNVEDEWLLVYLLRQTTRTVPGCVAKVTDTDGDFLLIQAADELPDWLQPETAVHRVFLAAGELHIVPRNYAPASDAEGRRLVADRDVTTRASAPVRACIEERLHGFPAAIDEQRHRVAMTLPMRLARILHARPALVAPFATTFYARDALGMAAAARLPTFNPAEGTVRVMVRMTRCLYAQIAQAPFATPAVYPDAEAVRDVGPRIAIGAEMLYLEGAALEQRLAADPAYVDVERDAGWKRYLAALERDGYFGAERAGSAAYRELEARARASFVADPTQRARRLPLHVKRAVDAVAADAPFDAGLEADDDDAWLNDVDEASFDRMLRKAGMHAPENGGGDAADPLALHEVAQTMKGFVAAVSEVDGVQPAERAPLKLDADKFFSILRSAMDDTQGPDSDDDSSDEDGDDEDDLYRDETMPADVQAMDREFRAKVQSGGNDGGGQAGEEDEDKDVEEDASRPVSVDFSVVENMLRSIEAQEGAAGPASNILGPLLRPQ